MLTLWAAPYAAAQPSPTFFLIDSSGSIDAEERKQITEYVELRRKALPEGSLVSISGFGSQENGGECGPVSIVEPTATPVTVSEAFGTPGRFTPLGSALDAVIRKAAPLGGHIVLVADGEESCARDVCSIMAGHRARYPNLLIEFKDFGGSPDILDTRGCIIARDAPQIGSTGTPQTDLRMNDGGVVNDADRILAVSADQRFYWVFLILLLPTAALQLSMHYSRGVDFANDVNREAKDYSDTELETLANSLRLDRIDAKYNNNDGTRSESACASVLVSIAALGMLLMLTSNFPYFIAARDDFWLTMNSNFLSESFAATVLVLAAFTCAQWWSRRRARKEVQVTIGDVRRDRHSQMHHELLNNRNRLSHLVGAIQASDIWLSKPRTWQKQKNDLIAGIFDPAKAALVGAATSRKPFTSNHAEGSIARLREETAFLDGEITRLVRYQGIRDATEFADALVKDGTRINKQQADLLESASLAALLGKVDEAKDTLGEFCTSLQQNTKGHQAPPTGATS